VRLGNPYGAANNAQSLVKELLVGVSPERWKYYLNHTFPSDIRILGKLGSQKPKERWYSLVEELSFAELDTKNRNVSAMLKASLDKKDSRFERARSSLLQEYYGK